ncbi:C40 family peptidase [Furfurilactobacillus milii]|uniref:NlpC/P60 domain-containing protein n=1 Tax=Furfurilactobacillus milii TaxID=2888272 RepID=A0A6N9I2H5_9LACO|nr:C40 family peptidase [Furfurilactobacillus milii]MYV17058.1 hypothetical protein [Furfurilactobacillus milii]
MQSTDYTYYFDPYTYQIDKNRYVYNADDNATYWLDDNGRLTSGNWRIEKAVTTGRALIGRSPYSWGGGRTPWSIAANQFDCSSFIHYIFASAGVILGNYQWATTYSEKDEGIAVDWSNMRRGDIFFFAYDGDYYDHVGMYLGNNLFLHDSPSSPTGGVGISSITGFWAEIANHVVRRVV